MTITEVLAEPTTELPEIGDPGLDFDPVGQLDPSADATAGELAPAPAPRRRPGPAPDPNSARQRRLAGKKAAAPRKKARPNAPAPATPAASPHEQGAMALLGWLARPLAAGAVAMTAAAQMAPEGSPRAGQLTRHAMALSLDSLTLVAYGEPLARGVAAMAPSLPWMARVLERAAQVSPFAELAEAALGIGLQLLANHGVLPFSPVLGTLSPAELAERAGAPAPPVPPQ